MREVADVGPLVIIERRGRPWVALVRISDPKYLEQAQPTADRPRGALAPAGARREIDGEGMESLVEAIYAARSNDPGRPVGMGI